MDEHPPSTLPRGYTGLSTAMHLGQRGLEVVVVEAHTIGYGCSGRNGGQVHPGLKLLPDDVEQHWGEDHGPQMVRLSNTAPNYVFDLIEQNQIDCAPNRAGTIRAAIDNAGLTRVCALVDQSAKRGESVQFLNADDMRKLTGTSVYLGGALDRRGGHINPLAYARGLALAAQKSGAHLYEKSRAASVRRDGDRWVVKTPAGSVSAPELVIGTNGYTDNLWPHLRQTLIPVWTYIVATDPLPSLILDSVMPSRAALFEAAWDVTYYRIDDAGRLLMGGRGLQKTPSKPPDYQHLISYAVKLFPELKGIAWPWHWHGQVAITRSHLPSLTVPEPGVHLMLGYNGRGIAMATVAGQIIAQRIIGKSGVDFPIANRLAPMPLHSFWRLGVNAATAGYLIRDAMRGR